GGRRRPSRRCSSGGIRCLARSRGTVGSSRRATPGAGKHTRVASPPPQAAASVYWA
ncbi:unnamed protein product, partial [Musa banksii]